MIIDLPKPQHEKIFEENICFILKRKNFNRK